MPSVTSTIALVVFVAGALPWALAVVGVQDSALEAAFHALCHQLPERTLAIDGVPMLVCSRCAGIYAGVALGVVGPMPVRWLPYAPWLLVGAAVLVVVEVVAQDAGLHPVWHPTRLGTGLAFGWVASAWMCASLQASPTRATCSGPGVPYDGPAPGGCRAAARPARKPKTIAGPIVPPAPK